MKVDCLYLKGICNNAGRYIPYPLDCNDRVLFFKMAFWVRVNSKNPPFSEALHYEKYIKNLQYFSEFYLILYPPAVLRSLTPNDIYESLPSIFVHAPNSKEGIFSSESTDPSLCSEN